MTIRSCVTLMALGHAVYYKPPWYNGYPGVLVDITAVRNDRTRFVRVKRPDGRQFWVDGSRLSPVT